MSRTVRSTIGVLATSLLGLVTLVAGLTALVASMAPPSFVEDDEYWYMEPLPQARATAEVLDVDLADGYDEWGEVDPSLPLVWIDVRYETAAGEPVVTAVEWMGEAEPPEVGSEVEVAYGVDDVEYDTWVVEGHPVAADGTWVADPPGHHGEEVAAEQAQSDAGPAVAALVVTGVSAVLTVGVGVLSVLWVQRAPVPAPSSTWGAGAPSAEVDPYRQGAYQQGTHQQVPYQQGTHHQGWEQPGRTGDGEGVRPGQ